MRSIAVHKVRFWEMNPQSAGELIGGATIPAGTAQFSSDHRGRA
jgi:hypothetical protein